MPQMNIENTPNKQITKNNQRVLQAQFCKFTLYKWKRQRRLSWNQQNV